MNYYQVVLERLQQQRNVPEPAIFEKITESGLARGLIALDQASSIDGRNLKDELAELAPVAAAYGLTDYTLALALLIESHRNFGDRDSVYRVAVAILLGMVTQARYAR